MAHLLAQLGRFTEALDYAGRALALVRDNGADSIIASCYREFVFVHQAAGHTAEAAEYQKKLDEKTAQSTNDRTRRQAALLKAQFEIERDGRLELARHDQALKAEQLRQARLQRYGLVALAALGVVAAAAVISRQRLKLAAERRVLEETRAARQTAEEASRLKTRLLGIASHDLKSPLSALIGCAKEIEQRPHDTALAAEFSALMRQEGEQMLTLVRDLLDLSAIESGQLKLACAPSDLVEIANRRVEAHRLAAVAKQQTLAVVCPDHAPVIVDADAARLAQVFDNLISNAVKFTPRGGAIEVRVETAGDRAMVRVRDGGPGLVPEDFARLFQPFQTLSAQPTGGESSSGLGLFIAREIVSRHGGTLGVDSAPGEGATFVFELPMGPAEPGRKSEIRSAKSETLSRSATA
jgi:signal transduction histidine kinase